MRVLLDTNILISREDDATIEPALQELLQLLNKLNANILVHPASEQDLNNDKNSERREKILSKIRTYNRLESPPVPSLGFIAIVGNPKNRHDEVDNNLLAAVSFNAVHLLITEDQGICKKAMKLGIRDRVHLIEDALEYLKPLAKRQITAPRFPIIEHVFVHNLDVQDPIFNELRTEYPDFNRWFQEIALKQRQAFVTRKIDKSLGAVLIYKFENEAILDCVPPIGQGNRLKLCTFIVSRTGYRIGELLIKLSISLCIKQGTPEIYLTHYVKLRDSLVDLIEEYGFFLVGSKTNGEQVFFKQFFPQSPQEVENIDEAKIFYLNSRYFPTYYDGPNVHKYLIPIQPQYHDTLFPEKRRQETLNGLMKIIHAEGNSIKKAYLCHAQIKRIKQNDILLFYRSQDEKAITAIGIVDQVITDLTDPIEIPSIVSKRTVYSFEEIQVIAQKPTLVLLFRLNFLLERPVSLEGLRGIGIPAPQSIREIRHEDYILIKHLTQLDERFTFH